MAQTWEEIVTAAGGIETLMKNAWKECASCLEYKPQSEFQKDNSQRDDRLSRSCKACVTVRQREYNYNMTENEHTELSESQGGVCAICGVGPGKRALHVDHDHGCCPGSRSCGICTRGLLCHNCNIALGLVKDSPDTLRAMVAYLEKYPKVVFDITPYLPKD